jgi:hypothetical protein
VVTAIATVFVFFCIVYLYASVVRHPHTPGPLTEYGDFTTLPEGTIVGDYWDVYKINAVAIDNLHALPLDYMLVRNWNWRHVALSEQNFYFIQYNSTGEIDEIIIQYGIIFKYSGINYNCNGYKILLYNRLFSKETHRYAIRASNDLFLDTGNDFRVFANQPDSAEAEVFEIISVVKNKALRTLNNKFLSANGNFNGIIYADSDHPWEWETFKIKSANSGNGVYILSSNGMYVCIGDQYDDALIANCSQATTSEIFTFEPR